MAVLSNEQPILQTTIIMSIEDKKEVFRRQIAALEQLVDLCETNTWTERIYLNMLIAKQEEYHAFILSTKSSLKKRLNNTLPSRRSLTGVRIGQR